MKILQIGLGSMGKRRLRNMFALGHSDIIAFDVREDRRKEAETQYGVKTIEKLDNVIASDRDVVIISTPPDKHDEYMLYAIENRKPAFVEASVIKEKLEEISKLAKEKGVIIYPSCTFRFHPTIKKIKELVQGNIYGKVCNFVYYMGQYLPDWHPWENIQDFYVSKKETSASREMIPFELTWIVDIFGMPIEISAFYGKTIDLDVDINDTYHINLKFQRSFGTIIVDVVSRFATRNLILNFERAHLRWYWDEKVIKIYEADRHAWTYFYEPTGTAHSGYNQNIIEEMYIDEMVAFLNSVRGISQFPNTLHEDMAVLSLLELTENSNKGLKVSNMESSHDT